MSDNKSIKTGDSGLLQKQAGNGQERVLRPPVDVYEDSAGITVKADLPGVSPDRLDVQVDGNSLTIEGQAQIDMPEGMEAVYADVQATRFRRSFTLSNELEADKITARLNNGELTLHLPKRAEVQPRKIEINAS